MNFNCSIFFDFECTNVILFLSLKKIKNLSNCFFILLINMELFSILFSAIFFNDGFMYA